ncbi:hypothetical protein GCWU000342_00793 [Shuttleworthella satelles DSM 14600]|uniref:Uncharacterized protein n=1 Tax=Shuttleworthella satelles DSM 14600 TaxID=626523 RepID=C4G9Y8_9FIRM|nr:hypothetical protein GCWU000342_00793 [Shuttleworthia satelles DSM 14600]
MQQEKNKKIQYFFSVLLSKYSLPPFLLPLAEVTGFTTNLLHARLYTSFPANAIPQNPCIRMHIS